MKRKVYTTILCMFVIAASADQNIARSQEQERLNRDQAGQLIRNTVSMLESEVSEEFNQFALRAFVLEFHIARTSSGFWNYTMKPDFQQAFDKGYRVFLKALKIRKFPRMLPVKDVELMLDGYSRNAGKFYAFLEKARETTPEYRFHRLSNTEIMKRQIEFSALVHSADYRVWKDLTSLWSIFVPISKGP